MNGYYQPCEFNYSQKLQNFENVKTNNPDKKKIKKSTVEISRKAK